MNGDTRNTCVPAYHRYIGGAVAVLKEAIHCGIEYFFSCTWQNIFSLKIEHLDNSVNKNNKQQVYSSC